jgi:hypothetical protein
MCRLAPLAVVLVFSAGVVGAQEAGVIQGARLLAPFKRDLQQALLDGLAQGPEEAIAACRTRAPGIAEALSRDGVRVGRASHRLRNLSNAAPDWVAPILDEYANEPSDRAPRTVSLGADRSGYVEPIVLQPLCLTCHGDNLAPEVASRIQELYPADRAVGYQAGDLRGVFWAEFPPQE